MARVCKLCKENIKKIDFKEVDKLKNYMMESGKILPRRATYLCAYHQRQIAKAIKQTRHAGLLPYLIDYYK